MMGRRQTTFEAQVKLAITEIKKQADYIAFLAASALPDGADEDVVRTKVEELRARVSDLDSDKVCVAPAGGLEQYQAEDR